MLLLCLRCNHGRGYIRYFRSSHKHKLDHFKRIQMQANLMCAPYSMLRDLNNRSWFQWITHGIPKNSNHAGLWAHLSDSFATPGMHGYYNAIIYGMCYSNPIPAMIIKEKYTGARHNANRGVYSYFVSVMVVKIHVKTMIPDFLTMQWHMSQKDSWWSIKPLLLLLKYVEHSRRYGRKPRKHSSSMCWLEQAFITINPWYELLVDAMHLREVVFAIAICILLLLMCILQGR